MTDKQRKKIMQAFLDYFVPGNSKYQACAAASHDLGLNVCLGSINTWYRKGKKAYEQRMKIDASPEKEIEIDTYQNEGSYVWFYRQCETKKLADAARIQKVRVDAALDGNLDAALKIRQEEERGSFNPVQKVDITKKEVKTLELKKIEEYRNLPPQERKKLIADRMNQIGMKVVDMEQNDDGVYTEEQSRTGS